ncbi:Cell cycle checkpoint protein RAD17-like protein [Dinothrombium tinctorium]|uniref:Cell cycle checkpoint protein RAD17-like protein n=1 Tax=Dinothrombium tinctorium TaxID=1965070 RepID=A0A3S3QDI9_9ACAR|nr:Cell cycle checkpoint protein RAD17-like protein [Dinothrombium tinctorium]
MESSVRSLKRKLQSFNIADFECDKTDALSEGRRADRTPEIRNDLCVNHKKVTEVGNWFRSLFNSKRRAESRVLLLTGPSGSGKTATVKVIAKEFGVKIEEFVESFDPVDDQLITEEYKEADDPLFQKESQLSQFKKFIANANCNPVNGSVERKVILIEEFPSTFRNEPIAFLETVYHYLNNIKDCVPIVFIFESESNDSFSNKFCFPKVFLEKAKVTSINFNPITTNELISVLSRVSNYSLRKEVLKSIAETSAGDIRNALNTFDFTFRSSLKTFMNGNSKKRRCIQMETDLNVSGRELCPSFFLILGKILHCKRLEILEDHTLPSHMEKFRTKKLRDNPEVIIDTLTVNPSSLDFYLHEHYLKFAVCIDQIAMVSSSMSDIDSLFGQQNWMLKSPWNRIQNYVVARSLLFYLSNSSEAKRHFVNFTKPLSPEYNCKAFELNRSMDALCFKTHSEYGMELIFPSEYHNHESILQLNNVIRNCFSEAPTIQNDFSKKGNKEVFNEKFTYSDSEDELSIEDFAL